VTNPVRHIRRAKTTTGAELRTRLMSDYLSQRKTAWSVRRRTTDAQFVQKRNKSRRLNTIGVPNPTPGAWLATPSPVRRAATGVGVIS
jgi:hypothetical protein